MLCGNCGHDERVHNEDTERCCAPVCRCSQFEVFDIEVEELIEAVESHEDCECGQCPDTLNPETEDTVKFMIAMPRERVAEFIEWLQGGDGECECETDLMPAEPMKIPDTIQPTDLNLNDQETRKWLIEKIRSKN